MKSSNLNRRDFLVKASLVGPAISAISQAKASPVIAEVQSPNAFDYRIAYGCWINDMRLDPLPLEEWPAPHMDDHTVTSLIKAMDVQSRFKYNYLDAWGFLATTSWPLNVGDGVDAERRKRVKTIISEAHKRGIKVIYGMGTYSWGFDKIIENDPSLTAKNRDGSLNKRAMCDANPKSFEWIKKILDFVLSEFDFDGLHLESFDLGGCFCSECAGKAGVVEYHCRINTKTAQYIRSKWPHKLIHVIPIGWAMDSAERFTASDQEHIIKMSKHIDGFYDQGWHGTYIAPNERKDFIKKLHCAYGTSGGRWVYPGQRWDRESFFIPHMRHQATAISEQYADGVRGIMHYQGPVNNPGTEMNIACGGLMANDTSQNIEDVVNAITKQLYRPRDENSGKKLAKIFLNSESAYFDQWVNAEERFLKYWKTRPAGEFYMDNLFGNSPGPAGYLANPVYLDAAGRLAYRNALAEQLRDLQAIENKFDDALRIKSLKRSMIVTLTMLNTIMHAKDEPAK